MWTRRHYNHKNQQSWHVFIVVVNDTNNYRKLQEDPTATNMKLVNDTIERLKKQNITNEKYSWVTEKMYTKIVSTIENT